MDRGIESFLSKKQIGKNEQKRILKAFLEEHKVFSFDKFHQWVDKGIKEGLIKGKTIPTVTADTLRRQAKDLEFKANSKKVPEKYYELMKLVKNSSRRTKAGEPFEVSRLIHIYFEENNLAKPKVLDNGPKAYEYSLFFEYLEKYGFEEDFKNFLN